MGETTGIAWTDHTFNPWWGCVKVDAPGDEPSECDNCYAESGSVRYGYSETGSKDPLWGKDSARRTFGDKHWNEPRRWDRDHAEAGTLGLVFSGSYCDIFEGRDDLDVERARLWTLIEETPFLIWQLLTKRPEQVLRRVPPHWLGPDHPMAGTGWPENVWIGTSVGTQRSADIRIPRLLAIPAPVRFLSCEPLLGPVDLAPWIDRTEIKVNVEPMRVEYTSPIGWVIVGGESGPGHRPMDLDHARRIRDHARLAGIPFFFKQVGGHVPTAGGDLLDGIRCKEFPPQAHRETPAVIG